MELILKSDNEQSLAKIIALAQKLNVSFEEKNTDIVRTEKASLKSRILKFKALGPSSFGDAQLWERNERMDNELPFSS